MYFWYNLLWLFLAPFLILFLLTKKRSQEKIHLHWRFGFYDRNFLTVREFSSRIWVHAASVGEINAITSFIKLLRESYPKAWIGISTMTPTGLAIAELKIPEANQHFIIPLDFWAIARRSMQQIRPTLFLTIETEIWPNLLKYAKQYGAAVVMINGRISVRKINIYLRFKSFFQKILGFYDACSMILPVDAERIIAMGAERAKVSVNGNVKFDSLSYHVSEEMRTEIQKKFHFPDKAPVLVAGSTREGEEELILQAFQKIITEFPELILIIAPRHIQRAAKIFDLVKQYNFQPLFWTAVNPETQITPKMILILNTMGELFKVYSLATIVFCGASLVKLGGQNPLEPAAWGRVVLYGPSMEDFLDAKKLLEEAGAGIEVKDWEDLAQQAVMLLKNQPTLQKLGAAGQQAVMAQSGASLRNLALVKSFIY